MKVTELIMILSSLPLNAEITVAYDGTGSDIYKEYILIDEDGNVVIDADGSFKNR